MAKTRGGGQVGSRRSRHNQGLRRGRKKKVAAQDDEVEDVTPHNDEVEDVKPQDEEVEDVKPQDDADHAEKAMTEDDKEDSEIEGEACLTGHEQKKDKEKAANMEEEGEDVEKENDDNEKENEEEALNMEEDGNISISLRQEAGSLKAESLTLLEFRNESQ
ncbi:hypothetical protein F2Q68_00015965 [Brassica cretica]|uniref:Uncharacterized protein n=1 Tax=Brassica cretica TaxID=69181 RepID=A0A8S9HLX4_BRACR|nr:hypothetical protein F2Q68_00015965 [Brassica cretica]